MTTTQPAIIANILDGRFAMTLRPEPAEEWFLDWVLRSPKHVSTHLTAGWYALNAVKDIWRNEEDIRTAYEPFGGMGAQALMVERLFNLTKHVVCDYSAGAVEHLEREVRGDAPHKAHIEVRQRDAYKIQPIGHWDLAVLDFGDLTAWKTRDGEMHRGLLDSVFAGEPKAVVMTDIACRYLHLHKDRYETLLGLGTCDSYDTYLNALAARLNVLYGYTLVAGYKDRWSSVFTLVPDHMVAEPGVFLKTPAVPVGLELL